MNLWMCLKLKNPKTVKSRKGKHYALWCISNSFFIFFNPSKSIFQKSRLKSHANKERMNNRNFSVWQKNNSTITQKLYNYSGNLIIFSEIRNALKTGKRNLTNLLHSFCNHHRTLYRTTSAETAHSFHFLYHLSKSIKALLCQPLCKTQTLSCKAMVMPIVK